MSFWADPINAIANWLQNWLSGLGLAPGAVQLITFIVGAGLLAVASLMLVIFLIWLERKLLGRLQDRIGPNRVGPFGLFQPFADMLKIFTKEYVTPVGADKVPFNLAPILMVGAVMMMWAVIPFARTVYGANLDVGVLYIVAVSGLAELAIVLAGWGSNNKYALLGALRAVAMLVSYEIPVILALLVPVMLASATGANGLSLTGVVEGQPVPFILIAPAAALIHFIGSLASIARAPFDLAEAESELVAGFMTEYSGLKFGFFYVAEFLHGITAALLFTVLFLGGWRGPYAAEIPVLGFVYFFLKTTVIYLAIVLLDGSLPRFRIDQVLDFSWKVLTPMGLALVGLMAIADQLMKGASEWVRVPVFLAVNLLLLAAAAWLFGRSTRPADRKIVTGKERPVARPENFHHLPE